jgi:hypothetical protein
VISAEEQSLIAKNEFNELRKISQAFAGKSIYICMYVCEYVYIYVCIIYANVYKRMYIYTYV